MPKCTQKCQQNFFCLFGLPTIRSKGFFFVTFLININGLPYKSHRCCFCGFSTKDVHASKFGSEKGVTNVVCFHTAVFTRMNGKMKQHNSSSSSSNNNNRIHEDTEIRVLKKSETQLAVKINDCYMPSRPF